MADSSGLGSTLMLYGMRNSIYSHEELEINEAEATEGTEAWARMSNHGIELHATAEQIAKAMFAAAKPLDPSKRIVKRLRGSLRTPWLVCWIIPFSKPRVKEAQDGVIQIDRLGENG